MVRHQPDASGSTSQVYPVVIEVPMIADQAYLQVSGFLDFLDFSDSLDFFDLLDHKLYDSVPVDSGHPLSPSARSVAPPTTLHCADIHTSHRLSASRKDPMLQPLLSGALSSSPSVCIPY